MYGVTRPSDANAAGFWRDQVNIWAEQRGVVRLVRGAFRSVRRGKILTSFKRGGAVFGDIVCNPHERYSGQALVVRHGESSRGE